MAPATRPPELRPPTTGRAPGRAPTGRASTGRAPTGDRRTGPQRRAEARRVAAARRDEENTVRRGRPGGFPPLVVVLAVVAALSLFVGVVMTTGFLTPPGAQHATATPPASATTVVRGPAASVAFDARGGWVADDIAGTVRRFDPSSGAWLGPAVDVGRSAVSITAGDGRVWAASALDNTVMGIDPATTKVGGTPVGVAADPVSVVAGEGGVWVASLGSGTVSLVDPKTLEVTASVALPDGAVRLALGDGAVWVTGQSDTLTRIDATPDGVTLRWKSIVVGQGPIGVAFGAGSVWVANALSGTVSMVDPHTLAVVRTITTGTPGQSSDPEAVAVWQGLVWVGSGESPTVRAYDRATGREVGASITVPGVVRELTVGDGSLWAATANPGRVVRLSR